MKGIEKSFYFMFREEGWPRKLGVGALYMLLSLFAVGIPFVAGYLIEVVRKSMNNESPVLPEWDRMREKFLEGIQVSAICFVYGAPPMLLMMYLTEMVGDSELGLGCVFILALVLYPATFLLVVQVVVTFARERELEPCMRVGDLIDVVFRNLKGYFLVFLVAVGSSFISGIVIWILWKSCKGAPIGYIIFVVLFLAILFWAKLVVLHAIGLTQRLPEPVPEEADTSMMAPEVSEPPDEDSSD